nr:hypothetical protein [Paraburkholderia diazotrophica]
MAESVLGFTIEPERIAGVAVTVIVGNVLTSTCASLFTWQSRVDRRALFHRAAARSRSALFGADVSHASHAQRRLMSRFGIRGIGSFYYLATPLVKPISPHAKSLNATKKSKTERH